jgi:hypothetical protein
MSRRLSLFLPFVRPPAVPEDVVLEEQSLRQLPGQQQMPLGMRSGGPQEQVTTEGQLMGGSFSTSAVWNNSSSSGSSLQTSCQHVTSSAALAGPALAVRPPGSADKPHYCVQHVSPRGMEGACPPVDDAAAGGADQAAAAPGDVSVKDSDDAVEWFQSFK